MIKIFNTFTSKKEDFKPITENHVKMYVCGMTVYDDCHVGHARVLIVFDLIYRWFLNSGYDVTYVRNITDIDDKIIKKSNDEGCHFKELTARYIESMQEDSKVLNIIPPTFQPKATEAISSMIKMISILVEKSFAYVGNNGDVFFEISKFNNYGKLSKKNIDDLDAGSRVKVDDNKKSFGDFVLWKLSKDDEPSWDSPWGKGRPGWHIECSAMSSDILGVSFDIHGGGQDLIFPHHENEIAQSESCHDHKMANYWIHNGFVNVDDEKMSKSLGNFFTLKNVLKNYSGEIIRFFVYKSHYRSPLNYSDQNLNDAKAAVEKIYLALRPYKCIQVDLDWSKPSLNIIKDALDDDFNSPKAISIIFELISELNKSSNEHLANDIYSVLKAIGLMAIPQEEFFIKSSKIDQDHIEKLIEKRMQAKKQKDYQKADELRNEIDSLGVILEDTPDGTVWRVK
ncbi:cysteine--tRNA ligase [Methylophilaceae bacterium]|nr:cysteine--tRNA ligase [Methylophilaceae bacterium]